MKKILFLTLPMLCMAIGMMGKDKTLPPIKYSAEPAVVKGVVKNVETASELVVVVHPVIGGNDVETKVQLDADGKGEVKVDLGVSSMVRLKVGNAECEAILVPGEETTFVYDTTEERGWTFSGALAAFNNDMANAKPENHPMRSFNAIQGMGVYQLKGKGVADYKKLLTRLRSDYMKKIRSAKGVSDEYVDYCNTVSGLYRGMMLTGYNSILNYANQARGEYTLPADYYQDFIDENLFAANAVGYSPFAGGVRQMVQQLGQQMGTTIAVPDNYEKIEKAGRLMAQISELKPLTDEQLTAVKAEVPEFEKCLVAANAAAIEKVEANKQKTGYAVKEIPADLAGEDVFKAIVAPYKGKPVLVDFWATWCGPCRAAMKTILPVKEEMAGKVNFLYVTGETSPKAKWNDMIPDIHGDHYYVTAQQWSTLLEQFKAQGIPAYVVVDRDGNVQRSFIGYPGNDEMKAEFLKAME